MSLGFNRTKERLSRGENAFGTLSLLPEPSLAELVGAVGFDFFVIDTEHAAVDERTVENMIRACQAARITPLVRTRHIEEKELLWILDSGAEGLLLPLVEDAETARRAYRLCRYPPEGDRTLCSATRAAARGAYRKDFAPFLTRANADMLLVALIETPKGVENARAIAREGIDAFIIGRADLSVKLFHQYAPNHPQVIDAAKKALGDVMEEGKKAGILAYDVDDARRWMDFGCTFVIYSQPEMLLATHYADALRAMRGAASSSSPASSAM